MQVAVRALRPAVAGAAVLLAALPGFALAQRCRVSDVVVAPPEATIHVGGSPYPFLATAYDQASTPCDVRIEWRSSNPAVATIDANGFAHAVSPGTATITAQVTVGRTVHSGRSHLTVEEALVEPQVTVSTVPGYAPRRDRPRGPGWAAADRQPDGTGTPENLIVEPLQMVLVRGESRFLVFHSVQGDGSNAAPVPIMFQVDPGGENIVAVDSFGLVTSRGEAGVATVRLSIPGQVRVPPKLVRIEVRADSLRFNRTNVSLSPGTVDTLSIFVPAQSRALDPGGLFQFVSSDTTVLGVNPAQPIVEARAPGTARIIAQSGLYRELSATIHVHRQVRAVRLEPRDTARTIAIGATTTVRAVALAEDTAAIPEAPLRWVAPDTAIASFDSATGTIRGRRAGTALISVFAPMGGDSAARATLRVRVVAGGLATARTRMGLKVGDRVPLDVQLLDEHGQPVMPANAYLTWTSTADSVAKVEGSQIAALRPGHARLTGRAAWDSTLAIDVFVAGDMLAVTQAGGRYDLFTYWNGLSGSRQLTSDSLLESQPAWSPDLTRVAFIASDPASRSPRSTLYVMDIDGSGRRALTDSLQARSPAWVPGANRLIFEWNGSGQPQVWAYDFPAAGTGAGTLHAVTTTAAPNLAPAASPTGDRIAYVSLRQSASRRAAYGIYVASTSGADERLVVAVPQGQRVEQPVFTPDGRALLFLRGEPGRPPTQRVYRISLAGGAADTAVAVTPPQFFVRAFSPNADGSVLALNTLVPAPNNGQVARVLMYTVASGANITLEAPGDAELSSAVLRPAAAASPAN